MYLKQNAVSVEKNLKRSLTTLCVQIDHLNNHIMKIKFIPFWKLYGTSETGFCLFEVYKTTYNYMANYDIIQLSIVMFSNKILIEWENKT